MSVRVFGVRHHGPGSARALGATLDAWQPDAVLVEGPPELGAVLGLAASPSMRPPVALLAYVTGDARRAAFYPLASWSPEWVAIQHALGNGVELRTIDLPATNSLAEENRPEPRGDPVAALAAAAGYDDPERWWEDVIEHRAGLVAGDDGPWEALTLAMRELREVEPPPDLREQRREAAMRQGIRRAERDGFERVAVVCGAWHAPALATRGPASADAALLSGLRKEKISVTWSPWTYPRLSRASGYGAGVDSPGWYEHLFASPDRPVERWLARVAGLLRGEALGASPASVVEAVRLAEALAALRDRPLAGLSECEDAARAVLAGGSDLPLSLVHERLVVGLAVGDVPPETPMVPLANDLAATARRLRLRPETGERALDLDLRKETDLRRSHLLHRLAILAVWWAEEREETGHTGTFREWWTLAWSPEIALQVVEASVWGVTVESAAAARAVHLARQSTGLAALTALLERCLLADLPEAVGNVTDLLGERAARSHDTGELLTSLPPLARTLRYGSVRRTDEEALGQVVGGLVARASVGLLPACASLDDDAAREMAARIGEATASLGMLADEEWREEWLASVERLAAARGLHGLLAGHACRLLLDAGRMPAPVAAARLSAALSPAGEPAHGAAFVEGLLHGSAVLLLHDPVLLRLLDDWVARVREETFDDLLPLLRRTFSLYEPGERRQLGSALRRLDGAGAPAASAPEGGFDASRGATALPRVLQLLGLTDRSGS